MTILYTKDMKKVCCYSKLFMNIAVVFCSQFVQNML